MARWELYNPSPSGRNVGDCSVRALSKALGVSWEDAYLLIAARGFAMHDMPSSNAVWGSVLEYHGFKRSIIQSKCDGCYTINDFVEDNPHGLYVICTGSHVATADSGILFDSWDSRQEVPVFYWSKEVNDV